MENINMELGIISENMRKWKELSQMKEGSIVELTTGEKATFIRLKKKNFIGIINGESFNIPIEMYVKVLEVAKVNDGYKTLKKGELFYISTGKDAILYTFKEIKNGKIVGICPITKVLTSIGTSLYAGKVSELI